MPNHSVVSVRRMAAALVAALALLIAGAATSATPVASAATASAAELRTVERGDRGRAVARVQRALGIAADGVFGRTTQRAVRRFQRRRGLTVDGVAGPATLAALGIRAASESGTRLPAVLVRIAQCESGGNPRAVSPDGTYRGKFQFTRDTWRRLGGKGDPAKASEAEQDRLALALYRREGTGPWAGCV